MPEWTWEPDDFAALWYSPARDRFPGPLRYTSRFVLRDEFAAHRDEVHRRYTADELEEIQLAMHTLETSDIRIEILGGTSRHRASTGPSDYREYRILGARNLYHAVVLRQSGTEYDHGPIRLWLIRTENLPARLTAAVPACRPGTAEPATFHPDDLTPHRDGYLVDAVRDTPHERYQRLLGRPGDGGGTAVLRAGPLYTDPTPWRVLQWHDITGDGRYTELRSTHITIRPTTPADLTTQFTTWIDRARHRLSESHDETW